AEDGSSTSGRTSKGAAWCAGKSFMPKNSPGTSTIGFGAAEAVRTHATTWSCYMPTAIDKFTRVRNCRRALPRPARGVSEGSSRMRRKTPVRFPGEEVRATSSPYPTETKDETPLERRIGSRHEDRRQL